MTLLSMYSIPIFHPLLEIYWRQDMLIDGRMGRRTRYRERQTDRDRQTDRQRHREIRQRQRHRDRQTEREGVGETQRNRCRKREFCETMKKEGEVWGQTK